MPGRRPRPAGRHGRLPRPRAVVRRDAGSRHVLDAGGGPARRDARLPTVGRPLPSCGHGLHRGSGGRQRELVACHHLHPGRPASGRPTRRGPRRGPDDGVGHAVRPAPHRGDPPRRAARSVSSVRVDVLGDRDRYAGLGVPTRLEVRTDTGSVRVDVPRSGRVDIPLPGGVTRTLAVEVIETDDGDPAGVVTGLVAVDLDGIRGYRGGRRVPTTVPTAPTPSAHRRAAGVGRVCPAGGGSGLLPGRRAGRRERGPCSPVASPRRGREPWWRAGHWTSRGGRPTHRVWPYRAWPSRRAAAGRRRWRDDRRESSTVTTAPPGARPPDDASPTLTLTLDEPADVRDVMVTARRGWMARHRPFVEVRLDDREEVVRASADGRLAVSGRDIRTVSIRVLPIVGGSRGAPASLEVEEIRLTGAEPASSTGAVEPALRSWPGAHRRRHSGAHPGGRSTVCTLG